MFSQNNFLSFSIIFQYFLSPFSPFRLHFRSRYRDVIPSPSSTQRKLLFSPDAPGGGLAPGGGVAPGVIPLASSEGGAARSGGSNSGGNVLDDGRSFESVTNPQRQSSTVLRGSGRLPSLTEVELHPGDAQPPKLSPSQQQQQSPSQLLQQQPPQQQRSPVTTNHSSLVPSSSSSANSASSSSSSSSLNNQSSQSKPDLAVSAFGDPVASVPLSSSSSSSVGAPIVSAPIPSANSSHLSSGAKSTEDELIRHAMGNSQGRTGAKTRGGSPPDSESDEIYSPTKLTGICVCM